jgi:hypothetical protein
MFAPRGWVSRPLARRIYKTIASSELFDKRWYRRHQMRGLSKLSDPLWHFLALGRKHQLDPSPMFDTEHYISSHHDVRDSNLNPLFHYLEYGIGERRQPIRSVHETFDHLFPDARELPTFLTARIGGPRLTVLIDQATMKRTDLALSQVLDSAAAEAARRSSTLRIISLLADNNDLVHQSAQASLSSKVLGLDIVTAPPRSETTSYEVHDEEVFLATSWTSAAAIRHATQPTNQWFLGADGLETNTRELWRGLSLGSVPAEGAPVAVSARSAGASDTTVLEIHAEPITSRELYAWTLSEIELMVRNDSALVDRLSIRLIGEALRPVNFLHSVTALVSGRPADEAASLPVSAADLIEQGVLGAKVRALIAQRGVR